MTRVADRQLLLSWVLAVFALIPHIMTGMDPARELGRLLLIGGIVLAAVGALLLAGGKLPLRLGRLPGDIAIEGKRGSFYFPIVTCILLSVVLTLVLRLVSLFRK